MTDHLVLCDPGSQEQEGYSALLHNNSFENDLDAAIADTDIKANQLYSRCVYSDIDNRK